jgi:polar amino acid transport system substrate-binding protein
MEEACMTFPVSRRWFFGAMGATVLLRPSFARAEPVTLQKIKESGVLNVGCEAAYVPFTYRDNSGSIVGFDVEVIGKYLEPIGVKPNLMDTQWSGVIPALYAGRFDMVPTMSYTKERLEKVLFSIPYADASQALLIRAKDQDNIKTISDMSGRVLGIKLGSPGETLKDKLDDKLKAERGTGFKDVKTYDDHPAAYLALAQGSVDGVLNTVPTLSIVLKDKPGVFSIVYNVGQSNWHGYAFRKEDTELASFINQRIRDLKATGEMAKLQEKYFGFTMPVPDTIPVLG